MHDNDSRGKMFKLRTLNPGNKTGESYGITIPKAIAERFEFTAFRISKSGTCIVLESGARTDYWA